MRIDLISPLFTAISRLLAGTEFGISMTMRSGEVSFMIFGVTAPLAAISTWKPSFARARLTLRICAGRPLAFATGTGAAAVPVFSEAGAVSAAGAEFDVTRNARV